MSIEGSTPFKEKDEFIHENEYGFDSQTVKDIKKTPEHSRDKRLKEAIEKQDYEFVEKMEDDDSAAKYVEQTEQEKMKRAAMQTEEAADFLDFKGKSTSSYIAGAAEYGTWLLLHKYFPQGYDYMVVPTKTGTTRICGRTLDTREGVVFVLKDPRGGIRMSAMGLSFDPMVDVRGLQMMAVNVENTVDFLEGNLEETDSQKAKKVKEIVDKYGNELNKTGTTKTN